MFLSDIFAPFRDISRESHDQYKEDSMEKIKIGQVVNAVGLKGELKVRHDTDYKERFEELKKIYLGNTPYEISGVRYMKEMVILKLLGVDDRTEAETHKGEDVCIDKSDVRVLPEDTYYIFDMIGMSVVDESGNKLGILSDVIKRTAQDLYEIEKEDKKKFLIPAVEEFILNIDVKNKVMTVRLIEGLMEV